MPSILNMTFNCGAPIFRDQPLNILLGIFVIKKNNDDNNNLRHHVALLSPKTILFAKNKFVQMTSLSDTVGRGFQHAFLNTYLRFVNMDKSPDLILFLEYAGSIHNTFH